VYVYGDCAINVDPNAAQLADIAVSSARTARAFGIEPRVALLSYATGESNSGDHITKVVLVPLMVSGSKHGVFDANRTGFCHAATENGPRMRPGGA
jgi:phosphotransacetylase